MAVLRVFLARMTQKQYARHETQNPGGALKRNRAPIGGWGSGQAGLFTPPVFAGRNTRYLMKGVTEMRRRFKAHQSADFFNVSLGGVLQQPLRLINSQLVFVCQRRETHILLKKMIEARAAHVAVLRKPFH